MKTNSPYTIAGAILAGGNACRMDGIAKGALRNDSGISIIQHLIDMFKRIDVAPVVIVANDPESYQRYDVEIIPDLRKGQGPLGGIESALACFARRSAAVMVLPCDLPLITNRELGALKTMFLTTCAPVVYAATAPGCYHPLCAVVQNDMLGPVSAALDRGERKIRNVWQRARALPVHFGDEAPFFNINTWRDVQLWQQSKIPSRSLLAEPLLNTGQDGRENNDCDRWAL